MKHNPKTHPRPGDRLAKLVADRNDVSRVITRIVLSPTPLTRALGLVFYTPKRVLRTCTLAEWRAWAKTATVVKPWVT